jgi:hypothetical protein
VTFREREKKKKKKFREEVPERESLDLFGLCAGDGFEAPHHSGFLNLRCEL